LISFSFLSFKFWLRLQSKKPYYQTRQKKSPKFQLNWINYLSQWWMSIFFSHCCRYVVIQFNLSNIML
jgi:ABC-type Fe3+ transport system permease subunit